MSCFEQELELCVQKHNDALEFFSKLSMMSVKRFEEAVIYAEEVEQQFESQEYHPKIKQFNDTVIESFAQVLLGLNKTVAAYVIKTLYPEIGDRKESDGGSVVTDLVDGDPQETNDGRVAG